MTKKTVGKDVELNDVRKEIRCEIEKRYGSVTKFLESPMGKKLGGAKIRPYLYESGAVNFEVTRKLCAHLGIGELTRKIVVSRSYFYKLNKNTPTD